MILDIPCNHLLVVFNEGRIGFLKNDLEVATEGGTFVSAAGGTFETVMGGTIKQLPSLDSLPLSFILVLHQTTKISAIAFLWLGCHLILFYIKPQHRQDPVFRRHRCHLILFYIKPQRLAALDLIGNGCHLILFYIKPQLMLTKDLALHSCHLILFYIKPQHCRRISSTSSSLSFNLVLHQTTTGRADQLPRSGCHLILFYIKPQRRSVAYHVHHVVI